MIEQLASGGMGVVFKARQKSLNRLVALKIIKAGQFASEVELKRFHTEAEAAASLEHPNIVPIYEVGTVEGRAFFSMKFMAGGSLADRFSKLKLGEGAVRAPFDLRRSGALISKIALAVHLAHQRGILHRDLKPANILLDEKGEPHVADFGLAKLLDVDGSLDATLSGVVLGTPGYLAPEQAAGRTHSVTIASDVFSLGAILYHLLTGRAPFHADTPLATIRQAMEESPRRPSTVMAGVDRDLETICLKCLEREPAKRYSSALALAEDLERWQRGEPILARPAGAYARIVKWMRRRPAVAALSALAVLLAISGVAGIAWQWLRAEDALTQAREALWQANLDRAQSRRMSGRMGQRVETLRLLRAAAAWRPAPELRNEAIAALALPDLEEAAEWLPLSSGTMNAVVDAALEQAAIALEEGRLELRRFAGGALLGSLPIPAEIPALFFSGDGARLAISSARKSQVWEPATGRVFSSDTGHPIRTLSADGRWMVEAHPRAAVVREVDSGNEIMRVVARQPSWAAFFDNRLAVESEGVVDVWDLTSRKRVGELTLPANKGIGSAWKSDGKKLAIGCDDRLIHVWDIESSHVEKLAGHHREGIGTFYHPTGELLASIAWDQQLRLWDPDAGFCWLQSEAGRPLGFSADGQWLAIRGAQGLGRLRVHSPNECRILHTPAWTQKTTSFFSFSPDDRLLAARVWEGFCVWDVATGKRLDFLPASQPESIQFISPNMALTSSGQGVALWTNAVTANFWRFSKHSTLYESKDNRIGHTILSPNRRQLLIMLGIHAGVFDSKAPLDTIPRIESSLPNFELKDQPYISNPVFSPDSRWIATGCWNNQGSYGTSLWLWGAEDGTALRQLPAGNCQPVFSPDGRWFLAASDKQYALFAVHGQPANWPVVWRQSRDTSSFGPGAAAFSPDGALVALQADSRIVRLLETASGRELARLTPFADRSMSLAWSHTGRWLAMSTERGPLLWDVPLLRTQLRDMGLDWEQ